MNIRLDNVFQITTYFLNLLSKRVSMVHQKCMFIAVPSCLKEKVEDVSPPSPRIQSALIKTQHCKIMLINTYFPQDPRCADFDKTEVTLMLSDIRNVMNKYV